MRFFGTMEYHVYFDVLTTFESELETRRSKLIALEKRLLNPFVKVRRMGLASKAFSLHRCKVEFNFI